MEACMEDNEMEHDGIKVDLLDRCRVDNDCEIGGSLDNWMLFISCKLIGTRAAWGELKSITCH